MGLSGQGILFAGKILAHAAVLEGYKATFLPGYGPQVQNGPVKAEVIINKNEIFNPFIEKADYILLFHRFLITEGQNMIDKQGVFICKDFFPESLSDYNIKTVNTETILENLKKPNIGNLVMLGAFSAVSGLIQEKSVGEALKVLLADKQFNLVSINLKAYKQGKEIF